jgi:hypothetical protein
MDFGGEMLADNANTDDAKEAKKAIPASWGDWAKFWPFPDWVKTTEFNGQNFPKAFRPVAFVGVEYSTRRHAKCTSTCSQRTY